MRGLRSPYQSRFPVIGIGNIVVGGVGKTVAVELVVRMLKDFDPAIVMRGYAAPDGGLGDEAAMLACHLSVPLVVAASRARGAQMLEEACDENNDLHVGVIVLDDAYQHQTLKKDLEILVIDARAPFDNGHLLPAGRLREKDTSRAQIFLFTHAISETQYAFARSSVAHANEENSFAFNHKLTFLHDFFDEQQPITDIYNKRIMAVAGIGSPQQFFDGLRDAGAHLIEEYAFIDHYEYRPYDVEQLCMVAEKEHVELIITTAKDWSKIKPLLESTPRFRQIWRVAIVELDGLTHDEPLRLAAYLTNFLRGQSAAIKKG